VFIVNFVLRKDSLGVDVYMVTVPFLPSSVLLMSLSGYTVECYDSVRMFVSLQSTH
jgi:hypothetical protein